MPSQFFGLNISYTGLISANAGLNTTANNISNAETDGYSRQKAIQEANRALRTFTTYGCAGAGVDTIAIERIRDEFYDEKFWDAENNLGEIEAKAYYMKTIENYFMDTESNAGFNTSFNLMYNALEELAKNAGDTSTKAQFVNYAQSLCDYFNNISGQLSELQKDVNMEIKDTTTRINAIAEQISTLNKQINVIELTGAKANELRDKRTLLLDELGTYVTVQTKETPIRDTNNEYDTGANRFIVDICGGQTLVDTNEYFELECVPRENNEITNQSDCTGLYDIRWSNGNDFNIYSINIGGKLQGLIEMRDGNNTENFRGKVSDVDLVNNKVKVKVDLEYLKDLDKCTLSSTGGIISLGIEEYYYKDWTYEYDPSTGDCYYTFSLDDNYGDFTLSVSRLYEDAEIGYSIDYQGIPYYQEQLNEFVRLYAKTFNRILTQDKAVDGNGNPADILFKATGANVEEHNFADQIAQMNDMAAGLIGAYTISSQDESYYNLTAANFKVSNAISADPDLMATRTGVSDGESKDDIVQELIRMKTDSSVMSFRGGNASEFLQSVLSDVALNANRANTSVNYYTTMTQTIDNQRISVSGVDSDEEASTLIRYQNAYNLAAKMISTFTEIYDRLILQTGV